MTALAFVLTIGPVSRFQRGKQVVSYLGFNPSEESSGGNLRSGIAEGLSAIEVPPRPWGGEGSHRTKVGGAAVWEAA